MPASERAHSDPRAVQEACGPDGAAREQMIGASRPAPSEPRQIDAAHPAAPLAQACNPHAGPQRDALTRVRSGRLEDVPRGVEMDRAIG